MNYFYFFFFIFLGIVVLIKPFTEFLKDKITSSNYINIIADLKGSLVFKENNFVGVCTFTYEKEAASTEM